MEMNSTALEGLVVHLVPLVTSVELRNNSTVFEELGVSIVDLTAANAVFLETRSGAGKTDIYDRQIHKRHAYMQNVFPCTTLLYYKIPAQPVCLA